MNNTSLLSNLECQTLNPFGLKIMTKSPDIWDIPTEQLFQLVLKHHLIIIQGFSTFDRDSLIEFCGRWGELLNWPFGYIFEVKADANPTNYLLSNGRVPFHWDGAFIDTVPSFEFFQCLKAPAIGSGGETLFCDTTRIWHQATTEQREIWKNIKITYNTESNAAHYSGEITVPLVSQHPKTGETRLRYGEPLDIESRDLTRLSMKIEGLPASEHETFLQEMESLIYSPQNCFVHQWQDGDLLIGDNHALLHARNKFSTATPRHLQRVHII